MPNFRNIRESVNKYIITFRKIKNSCKHKGVYNNYCLYYYLKFKFKSGAIKDCEEDKCPILKMLKIFDSVCLKLGEGRIKNE